MCELQRHACSYNLDIVPTNLEYCLEQGGSGTLFEGDHQLKGVGVAGKCGSQICPSFAECMTVPSNVSSGTVEVCQCASTCPQGIVYYDNHGLTEMGCNFQVAIQTNCPMITQTQTLQMTGPCVLLTKRMATSKIMQMYVNCDEMLASGKWSSKFFTVDTAVCLSSVRSDCGHER